MATQTNEGTLVWRNGGYVREDNRPEPTEVTAAERRELLDEVQAELEAAAIERGATPEQAKEGARFRRGQFRVHSAPAGISIQAKTHGVWGALTRDGAIRHLAHQIVTDARKEAEKAAPDPTPAEMGERIEDQFRRDPGYRGF